jgi:hypothetical protein
MNHKLFQLGVRYEKRISEAIKDHARSLAERQRPSSSGTMCGVA